MFPMKVYKTTQCKNINYDYVLSSVYIVRKDHINAEMSSEK